jgi:hypothetical protein
VDQGKIVSLPTDKNADKIAGTCNNNQEEIAIMLFVKILTILNDAKT